MHTVHHTRAVIIKSQPSRESDKMFWLFTEELGLVVAVATGVRKSGAKLKGQLVDYAFVDVDLVQGREVWRLISATLDFNPLEGTHPRPIARGYVRILATLDRFLVGEGAHPELFAHIETCARALSTPGLEAAAFDALAIWKIVVLLGYIAVGDDERMFRDLPFVEAVALLDAARMRTLVGVVNNAIKETHL